MRADSIEAADAALRDYTAYLNSLDLGAVWRVHKEIGHRPIRKRKSGLGFIDKTKPCAICGFKTEPAHDGRRHRGQWPKMTAFTDDELLRRNLSKIS